MKHRPDPRHALAWLGGEPEFAQLRDRVRRLGDLQRALARCVPGVSLNVVSLEAGVLVIGAAQASAAAKVRQFGPTLLAELNREGWRVERIRFKPRLPEAPRARPVPKPPLAQAAIERVAALADSVADPRLRDALRRMARRHGG
jgi:hypothetical protein